MPHSIAFDSARKRITLLVIAPVDLHEALECCREVRADPKFASDYGILLNSLAADRPPDEREGEAMATVLAAFFPNQKIAFVRRNPPFSPGIEAVVRLTKPNLEVKHFPNLDSAEAWLGS